MRGLCALANRGRARAANPRPASLGVHASAAASSARGSSPLTPQHPCRVPPAIDRDGNSSGHITSRCCGRVRTRLVSSAVHARRRVRGPPQSVDPLCALANRGRARAANPRPASLGVHASAAASSARGSSPLTPQHPCRVPPAIDRDGNSSGHITSRCCGRARTRLVSSGRPRSLARAWPATERRSVMPTPRSRAGGEIALPSAPLHLLQPRTWPFGPRPAHLAFAPSARFAWPAALAAGRGHNQPLLWTGPHAATSSGMLPPAGACVTRHRASVVMSQQQLDYSTPRRPSRRSIVSAALASGCAVVGAMVTPFALQAAVDSAGGGEGHYVAARACFPILMLLTRLCGDRITSPLLWSAFVQFPLYGGLLGIGLARGWRGLLAVAVLIAVLHGGAAVACFCGLVPNFS